MRPSWRDSFLRELTVELEDKDLILPNPLRKPCMEAQTAVGFSLQVQLTSDFEELAGTDLALAFGISRHNLVHLLAHGYSLTRYLIAPILAAGEVADEIARIGALLSLLITVYDHGVDDGQFALLSGALAIASMSASTENDGADFNSSVTPLLRLYSRKLRLLPDGGRKAVVSESLLKHFALMFDDENKTVTRSGIPYNQLSIVRKSALPAVVLSLPVFMVSNPETLKHFWRHLRWCYMVGDYLGLLDDAVDLERDLATRQANRFSAGISDWKSPDRTELAAIVSSISSVANRVTCMWRMKCGSTKGVPLIASSALAVSTSSWLGVY